MTRDDIIREAEQFVHDSSRNYISEEIAIKKDYVGMKIFDAPIFAFGYVDDELYTELKDPLVIGPHFQPPLEWLSEAKTIISFFLPYTERIKSANARDFVWPADEWLHGRIEGQELLKELAIYINKLLTDAGYNSLVPIFDPRFKTGDSRTGDGEAANRFTSNWSERHIAYVCGLGTFGLSKGLITEKGVSGRFGSILTALDIPKTARAYSGIYDYCTMCYACIPNCPVNAISKDGKEHESCSAFLDKVHEKHYPRYGCGKCQVGVPCESRAPGKK